MQTASDDFVFFFPRRLKEIGRDDPAMRVYLALLQVQ